MWALLISRPLWSHMVPVALPAAGHEVAAVATRVTLGDELARVELQDLAIPRMLASSRMRSDPDHARRVGLSVDGVPLPELGTMERRAMFGRLFAGVTAVRVAQDTAASGFQPDIEVRECTEMGGYLLAEPLELPCATLDIAPLVQPRHPGMLPWLNDSHAALGLLPACDHFLTHAAFNGARDALTTGVPMVALPLHAEQPANAQRLFELGVGVGVRPESRTRRRWLPRASTCSTTREERPMRR